MFTKCCAGNVSPKQENDDKNHYNPMYRKLGGRKNLTKVGQQSSKKGSQTSRIQTSIIKACDLSNFAESHRDHSLAYKDLVKSVLMPNSNIQAKPNIQPQIPKIELLTLQKEGSEDINMKYSKLQQKYIGVLERSNLYLKNQLQKSRANSQTQIKSHSASKISSQLVQLKNRLNKIDLSAIKKLAGRQEKMLSQSINQKQNKQNELMFGFRHIRSKIK